MLNVFQTRILVSSNPLHVQQADVIIVLKHGQITVTEKVDGAVNISDSIYSGNEFENFENEIDNRSEMESG